MRIEAEKKSRMKANERRRKKKFRLNVAPNGGEARREGNNSLMVSSSRIKK